MTEPIGHICPAEHFLFSGSACVSPARSVQILEQSSYSFRRSTVDGAAFNFLRKL